MVNPTILAIGAHPDDVALGCGATLAMQPAQVVICTLTDCGISDEWEACMRVLDPQKSILHTFQKRTLNQFDVQEGIRETLEHIRDAVQPQVVFTHHPSHTHQDHRAIYEETMRVFKWHTILGYSMAGGYTPNLYIPVTEAALAVKLQMLTCYGSQEYHRDGGQLRYAQQPTTIEGVARYYGSMIRAPYAEAFELIRGVWTL